LPLTLGVHRARPCAWHVARNYWKYRNADRS
jgi:hypothetical protein